MEQFIGLKESSKYPFAAFIFSIALMVILSSCSLDSNEQIAPVSTVSTDQPRIIISTATPVPSEGLIEPEVYVSTEEQ